MPAKSGGITEEVRTKNPRLAGWYAIWLGAANSILGRSEPMFDWFDEARNRLGGKLPLPRQEHQDVGVLEPTLSAVEEGLREFCALTVPEANRKIAKFITAAQAAYGDPSHKKSEEAIRVIGATLGFESRRPDTDEHDGPDNIWIDHHTKIAIPIELKSDKLPGSPINSDEVGQIFQYLEWTKTRYSDYLVPGILVYTEADAVTESSNPSGDMYFSTGATMKRLQNSFIAAATTLAKLTPLEKYAKASGYGSAADWQPAEIFNRLKAAPLKSQ